MNGVAALRPLASACLAIEATRVKSSYDEFVHDPMRDADILSCQPFSCTIEANLLRGVAKSGVCGPLLDRLSTLVRQGRLL